MMKGKGLVAALVGILGGAAAVGGIAYAAKQNKKSIEEEYYEEYPRGIDEDDVEVVDGEVEE